MRFGNDLSNRIERALILGFSLLIAASVIGAGIEGSLDNFSVVILIILFYLMVYSWYEIPTGRLTEEGIYVRHFFIRRFYRWADIRQVGIVSRSSKSGTYYQIVLVKPCGSIRTPETKAFLFRNQFRLIHIPYDELMLHYIKDGYGRLDFDQRSSV